MQLCRSIFAWKTSLLREARWLSDRKQTRAPAYLGRFWRWRARLGVPGAGSAAMPAAVPLWCRRIDQQAVSCRYCCLCSVEAGRRRRISIALSTRFRSRNQRRRTVRVWCDIVRVWSLLDYRWRVCAVCSGRSWYEQRHVTLGSFSVICSAPARRASVFTFLWMNRL